jgi:hypothetical protein
MRKTLFQCDRCDAEGSSRLISGQHFPTQPSGWLELAVDRDSYELCPTCADDFRLMMQNFLKVTIR